MIPWNSLRIPTQKRLNTYYLFAWIVGSVADRGTIGLKTSCENTLRVKKSGVGSSLREFATPARKQSSARALWALA
jgi:hypothetical protein